MKKQGVAHANTKTSSRSIDLNFNLLFTKFSCALGGSDLIAAGNLEEAVSFNHVLCGVVDTDKGMQLIQLTYSVWPVAAALVAVS